MNDSMRPLIPKVGISLSAILLIQPSLPGHGRQMGERSDRVRSHQHHRLPHRRFQQEARQRLPGGLEEVGSGHVSGRGEGERVGPGGADVRRTLRPRRGVQQAAEEEAGRVPEQHEEVQQREQGAGLQRLGRMGHALGARG